MIRRFFIPLLFITIHQGTILSQSIIFSQFRPTNSFIYNFENDSITDLADFYHLGVVFDEEYEYLNCYRHPDSMSMLNPWAIGKYRTKVNMFTGRKEVVKRLEHCGSPARNLSFFGQCTADSCYYLTTFSRDDSIYYAVVPKDSVTGIPQHIEPVMKHLPSDFPTHTVIPNSVGLFKNKKFFWLLGIEDDPYMKCKYALYTFTKNDMSDLTLLKEENGIDNVFLANRTMSQYHMSCDSTVLLYPRIVDIGNKQELRIIQMDPNTLQTDTLYAPWMEGVNDDVIQVRCMDDLIPQAPSCYITGSLDEDESSASSYEYGYRNDFMPMSRSLAISDDDVVLETNGGRISSIIINIDEPQDHDSLEASSVNGFEAVYSADRTSVSLSPWDKHDIRQAEEALRQVRYTNGHPNRSSGTRLINVKVGLTSGQELHLVSEVVVDELVSTNEQPKTPNINYGIHNGALRISSFDYVIERVAIFNSQGRLYRDVSYLNDPILSNEVEIAISDMIAGIYFIQVQLKGSTDSQVLKLVKI